MKKLIVICMLIAIGAVGMIEKSYAQACREPHQGGLCGGPLPAEPVNPLPNQWQGNPGNGGDHNWNGNPNWNANNGNGGQWWQNRPHRRHNWNNGPTIGLGIYTGPGYNSYNDGPYYDEPYYGDDPYAYSYRPRAYGNVANRCNAWAQRLRGLGYRNVRATDCVGTSYVYRATKAGKPVKVTVRASSGSVIRVANAY